MNLKIRNKFVIALIFASIFIAGASAQAPNITSWGNTKTNDNSTGFSLNTSEDVTFNATANQSITTWNWFIDSVAQSNNFDNLTTNFSSAGTHIVEMNATNANGTSNTVTWTVTVTAPPLTIIKATVDIKPKTINLKSKGKFTAFISLPSGFNVRDIIPTSVKCDGASAIKWEFSKKNGGTMIVKFNRQDLVNVPAGKAVTLTVTGKIFSNGNLLDFQGSDTIKVIDEGKGKEEKDDEDSDENVDEDSGNNKDKKINNKDPGDDKKGIDTKVDNKEPKNKGKDKVGSQGKNKGKK